jgi:hypothetical protein
MSETDNLTSNTDVVKRSLKRSKSSDGMHTSVVSKIEKSSSQRKSQASESASKAGDLEKSDSNLKKSARGDDAQRQSTLNLKEIEFSLV